MKRLVALLLPVLILLGFALLYRQEETPQKGDALVYLLAEEGAAGGDAIAGYYVDLGLEESATPQERGEAIVETLISGVPGGRSPLPSGVYLRSISIQGSRAYVDFSSRYSSLTGIDLSLADYCITLSLTQLDAVSSVSITSMGREIFYRDNQVLMEQDVLLSTMGDVIETVHVTLYFVNEDHQLAGEPRALDLYEGQSPAESLMSALLEGPQTLVRLLPEEFTISGVRVEEGVCYLSLPQRSIDILPEDPAEQRLMLQSIAYSLYSLDTVEELRILVDGQEVEAFGQVPVEEFLFRPEELSAE